MVFEVHCSACLHFVSCKVEDFVVVWFCALEVSARPGPRLQFCFVVCEYFYMSVLAEGLEGC